MKKIRKHRGIILLLVLVIVSVLALACLTFAELMLNERKIAQTASQLVQVQALAYSGAELSRQFLDRTSADQTDAGGIYDNPERFANVLIADDVMPQKRGRCSIVAPRIEDRIVLGLRYGLQDESSRINLATLLQADQHVKDSSKTILMTLPSMTDEIADAILDWIDSDSTTRENGAESDYYAALTPPYSPRNGPPVTIDELLLVRGVTPELLYGLDAVRMGLIPADSVSGGSLPGVDNSDGSMDHGWAAYLTLWSAESNLKADGSAKIDLNSSDLDKLSTDLTSAIDKEIAEFIVSYRKNGPHSNSPNAQPKPTTISSILDLVGATTTKENQGHHTTVKSPITKDTGVMSNYLPKLLDNTTVYSGTSVAGRININRGARVVLTSIPGMTADIVDKIISSRTVDPTLAAESKKYETWPLTEGVVPLETMKALQPFITAGGSVYRAQIIGSFEKGGPVARLEVVLDATQQPTKQLFWKDMGRMSGGFPVEPGEEAGHTVK